jgi:glycosyltransferase involved in cell wall biosynthesis
MEKSGNQMVKKVKILYTGSSLCSEALTEKLFGKKIGFPDLAAQKFHRLFAQGIALNPDLFDLEVVGVPEVRFRKSRQIIFKFKPEIEKSVHYSYITVVLVPVIRYFIIALILLKKISKWGLANKKKEKIIIFDILNTNISIFTFLASRLFKVKLITIVTDLPEMMHIHKGKQNYSDKLNNRIQNYVMSRVDGYIVLTEALNRRVNKKNKPFLLMEGLADIGTSSSKRDNHKESKFKIILYSGGLYEKNGIIALMEAFSGLSDGDCRLHIYGHGDLIEYIEKCAKKDPRICFCGYVDNSILVESQRKASVLVNPRFSHEEYTKYSFPSKNLEYMSSGIPLVTTMLQGMPREYFDYVYLFEEESADGYKRALQDILNKPREELLNFGARAKEFVVNKKNNKLQARKFYSCFVSN